jgi:ferrous iron transport protein A
VNLARMKVGQSAKVASIEGDDAISVRLLEMGLTPGVEIQLLGTAPLGDPLEIELRGYRLTVRKTEAERIAVSK